MVYYHGSPNLFTEFDLDRSRNFAKSIHFSPHKMYAIAFATEKTINKKGYLYTVNIEGHESLEYHKSMSNVCLNNLSKVTIIKVEEVSEKDYNVEKTVNLCASRQI